jgi:hypothetical protein
MARLQRIKPSKHDPLGWFLKHYGVGGAENYDREQIIAVLQAFKFILDNAGAVELDFISRFLYQLSENPRLADKFYDQLIEYGIE